MTTVLVARVGELPDGAVRRIRSGGLDLVVVHAGGEVHVLGNECPHAGAALHEGVLDQGCLTCPWHGSRFDVRTGAALRGPAGRGLRRHPTRVEGDWLVIDA